MLKKSKSYQEKYNKIVQKIGNLILLHKDTNSRKQNKNSEPICQNIQDVLIQGAVDKNGNSKLESLCNKGLYYEIAPTDKDPKNLEKYKEDFKKIEELIDKRTDQIFDIYFEIFFNKREKTK
ncbi:DUF1524 domain-containing protein [Mesomycoplasma ovipneumoniae]|uniref:DUF1524 domain-containing protein n=1 Tax=Mesomycoplasma ovipneumoniae TaxID=29562 RepID=A0AAW6Q7P3_9BACT|nr:DUF1524 domain-containing protein [Mesomycoplasma ovipneumoniae]MDF9627418.1 DUF1524 domain-containing protein [Mesomycoplasma ovipneumoniae]MDO4157471.1 DUF1524 domain-containing protein [Mesomycoplasma ovipneumoniae]MDO4158557.1 DUF1524 domain-containing protein [Mesomycoplasma ovipneumoniae]MDO6821478.1 DUF1524 domain-containing protein [Mesomycoplasma ovipneumoniae]MDO6855843.1 DUF1524 domain-containing protein [Mesomycoplasma ovipneumoniae]